MSLFGRRKPGFSKEVELRPEDISDEFSDRNDPAMQRNDNPKQEKAEYAARAQAVMDGMAAAGAASAPEAAQKDDQEGKTVDLFDYHQKTFASLTHKVRPDDILIRKINRPQNPYSVIHPAKDTANCINIAFVAEGYTKDEMASYIDDVKIAVDALFSHATFNKYKDYLNIVAVESPSKESGTSEPGNGKWINTALSSHFNTFYSDRYLTTLHLKQLHDQLVAVPYEHIIVLVNSTKYGGGGIYNSYTLTPAKDKSFRPVVVHEFGHSFGGLADEYTYSNDDPMYFPDTEPWEQNITTKHDFSKKWGNLIEEGKAGLVEGGGYLVNGVWRGCETCRMRVNEVDDFCPVCQQALERLILFYIIRN